MKILALEHELPGTYAGHFQQFARVGGHRIWELYPSGSVGELYFRADRDEAMLVLESASVAEAQNILATLPFVGAGLITFEVVPLKACPVSTAIRRRLQEAGHSTEKLDFVVVES